MRYGNSIVLLLVVTSEYRKVLEVCPLTINDLLTYWMFEPDPEMFEPHPEMFQAELEMLEPDSEMFELDPKWYNTKLAKILSEPRSVADLRGARGTRAPPGGPNSFDFMQFFGKIWQNRMLVPPSGELVPPPQGNPGSATEDDHNHTKIRHKVNYNSPCI